MTRRRFLQWLVLGLGAIALLVAWRSRRLFELVARFARPRLDRSSPPGLLSAEEMATIIAFAEVLAEGRPLSPAELGYLADHVNDRTQRRPGYLSLYRTTAQALDRLTRTRFSALELGDRTAVITRHRLAESDVRIRECLLPFRRRELAIRALAVPDLLAGYYGSPAGWAVVGYAAFPGRCGDLARYTRSEA